ncbi:phosphatase and actin regulator 2 [Trichonephila clavipes]|nr:phosphatase and actin regulator 2 [Trichonephila clavipes]
MYKNALKEDLIRVVEDLDGTVESMDTIAKLKSKIEKSSTFESDADFVETLIKTCIDERVSRNEREATLENRKLSSQNYILCKKVNGAMKTSSVGSNSRSPTPSPMEGKHSRFAMLGRLFKPWKWKRKKRAIVLNRRPEL